MRIKIDFPPYKEVEVIEIHEDGSVRCSLFGDGICDTDITISPDSPYYPKLTDEEILDVKSRDVRY